MSKLKAKIIISTGIIINYKSIFAHGTAKSAFPSYVANVRNGFNCYLSAETLLKVNCL